MKYIKNTLILILSIFLFSCYQAPESSSGSVSIKLNSSVMRNAPDGFDGELRLAVFDDGDLDSLIDITTGINPEISYLGDFPTPLLANNSVPFTGNSGVLSLLNVPADRPLSLLIEHYHEEYYFEDPIYFMTYAGLSDSFEVKGGGTAEVAITLVPTANGSVSIIKTFFPSIPYFWVFADEDYESFITIDGSEIKSLSTSTTVWLKSFANDGETYWVSNEAILPGKKFRLMVSQNSYINNNYPDVGISGTFEVQPGLTKSVSLTMYNYYNDSCIGYC